MKVVIACFRLLSIWVVLSCCLPSYVMGQLTAHHANGYALTDYYRPNSQVPDTIFVFNQMPNPQTGNLSLQYRPPSQIVWKYKAPGAAQFAAYTTFNNVTTQCSIDTLQVGEYQITTTNTWATQDTVIQVTADDNLDGTYTIKVMSNNTLISQYTNTVPQGKFTVKVNPVKSTFNWYRFDYGASPPKFGTSPFYSESNVITTSVSGLSQGGYKVTVKPASEMAPRDSFVTWLYMNPGFDFKLQKNNEGAVIFAYKYCDRTDFLLDPSIIVTPSSFDYYNPATSLKGTLHNNITFMERVGNGAEMPITLRSQGGQQYFRDYYPPYQDSRYYFRGYDMFGVEKKDDIWYETIIPHADMTVILPTVDPTSAPVDVRFVNQSVNVAEYVWRFGDGDSIRYNLEYLPPDTVRHTYYTPKTYTATLVATSIFGCQNSISKQITVSPSALDVGNVFTPNGDNMNDYFKPYNVSIRQFEISIYTRAGSRIYHYKGNDLRSWEGWDGRIQHSGKDAAEGIYFYVIQATSWDDPQVKYSGGIYKGYVHLYR